MISLEPWKPFLKKPVDYTTRVQSSMSGLCDVIGIRKEEKKKDEREMHFRLNRFPDAYISEWGWFSLSQKVWTVEADLVAPLSSDREDVSTHTEREREMDVRVDFRLSSARNWKKVKNHPSSSSKWQH